MIRAATTSILLTLAAAVTLVLTAPAVAAPAVDASSFARDFLQNGNPWYDAAILQEAKPAPAPQQPAPSPSTVVEEWTEYGECIDGTRTVTHWSRHSDGSIASSLSSEPCALICVDGLDGDGNLCGFCYDPVLTSPADLDYMWDKYCPIDDPPLKETPRTMRPREIRRSPKSHRPTTTRRVRKTCPRPTSRRCRTRDRRSSRWPASPCWRSPRPRSCARRYCARAA